MDSAFLRKQLKRVLKCPHFEDRTTCPDICKIAIECDLMDNFKDSECAVINCDNCYFRFRCITELWSVFMGVSIYEAIKTAREVLNES